MYRQTDATLYHKRDRSKYGRLKIKTIVLINYLITLVVFVIKQRTSKFRNIAVHGKFCCKMLCVWCFVYCIVIQSLHVNCRLSS